MTEWQVPAANLTGTIMRWLAEDGNVQYVRYRRHGKDGYKLVFIKSSNASPWANFGKTR